MEKKAKKRELAVKDLFRTGRNLKKIHNRLVELRNPFDTGWTKADTKKGFTGSVEGLAHEGSEEYFTNPVLVDWSKQYKELLVKRRVIPVGNNRTISETERGLIQTGNTRLTPIQSREIVKRREKRSITPSLFILKLRNNGWQKEAELYTGR